MIDGLIGGKMRGAAAKKTGGSGKSFYTAKVKASIGEAGDVFVNVIAFSETVGATLLSLGDGEAVCLAGSLKPGAWTDKEGVARPSLDMVASAVLTSYHVQKKRKAIHGSDDTPKGEKPSHDAWKARRLKPDHSGLDDGAPLVF